jgi:hypothetical protein
MIGGGKGKISKPQVFDLNKVPIPAIEIDLS